MIVLGKSARKISIMSTKSKTKTQDHLTLGIDLGGTKVLATVVNVSGKILGSGKKLSQADQGAEHVAGRIIKACEAAIENAGIAKSDIKAMGIGAPGAVDDESGMVIGATNLPGFDRFPLGKRLRAWHDVPLALTNDVRAATYGEMGAGAGKGYKHVVVVFVGTGIGGGLVMNGHVHTGARNAAGELGHMITLPDGPYTSSPTTVRGGLESLASRTAIERDLRAGMAQGRKSVLSKLLAERGNEMTSGMIAKALGTKDRLTMDVLDKAAHYLGLHAASLINALDPELFIYGGGLIEALGDYMLPIVRKIALENTIYKAGADKIKFVKSPLGDNAGALGASFAARAKAGI